MVQLGLVLPAMAFTCNFKMHLFRSVKELSYNFLLRLMCDRNHDLRISKAINETLCLVSIILPVDSVMYDETEANLKCFSFVSSFQWICRTILNRLIEEITEVNKALVNIGSEEVQIGG